MGSDGYRPAHQMRVTVSKSKTRVTCICGWQATRGTSQEEAEALYRKHAGLTEKR